MSSVSSGWAPCKLHRVATCFSLPGMSGEFDSRRLLWQSGNVNQDSIKPKPNFCSLAKRWHLNLESKLASPLYGNSHQCCSTGLLAEALVIGASAKVRLFICVKTCGRGIKIQVSAPSSCHHRHRMLQVATSPLWVCGGENWCTITVFFPICILKKKPKKQLSLSVPNADVAIIVLGERLQSRSDGWTPERFLDRFLASYILAKYP